MYARMAKEAREEGFEELAVKFENVARVEKEHEERYLKLLANVEKTLYSKMREKLNGCADSADTYIMVLKLLKVVQLVDLLKLTLKEKLKTIKMK